MAGGTFRFDRANAEKSLDRIQSLVVIFALTLAYSSMFCRHVHVQSVDCNAENRSEKFQHCGIYADGVRSLDCFGRHNKRLYSCTWEPGERAPGRTYTLVVQDGRGCRAHHNITGSNRTDLKFFTKTNVKPTVTVEVYQDVESANCTKAVFRGLLKKMMRCAPPGEATFTRQSGRLEVKVKWQQDDRDVIKHFHVRHGVLGSQQWSESPARSEDAETCVLEDLNATLAYGVQIQCVASKDCSQCVWSRVHSVSPELTAKPVVVDVNETDIGWTSGRRLLTLTWEFPSKQQHDSYLVTVGKASGEEPKEHIRTREPRVALILSYSAYRLQVSAVSNVSTSPALDHVVRDKPGLSVGKLNVTIESNTSFTIYWGDNLIQKYVCYSAEWRTKGGKTVHMSFFQDRNNYRTLSPLPEALEPFTRYSLTLHTRPNKNTCNMKSVNHSESTYGTTQFYFTEGSPVSGPENITFTNVTVDSAALQWTAIPEEDLRGFLLGYIIRYAECNHKGTMTTGTNITVGPEVIAYTLGGLKGGTEYEIQISGFTRTGEGAPTQASLFTTTEHQGSSSVPVPVLAAIAVVTVALIFGTLVVERAKAFLWPSIPNPRHSNALQKLGRPCELELLETINTLKVEEGDTDSLQIVDKDKEQEEEAAAASAAAEALLPWLPQGEEDEEDKEDEEDEDHFAESLTASIQGQPAGGAADISPYIPADAFTGGPRVDLRKGPPPATVSGYTTLEMFQQSTPQGAPAGTQTGRGRQTEEEEVKPRSNYIRPLSTNSVGMSTFL
ncbi:leukemia inhibitory factor receptor [Nelusetta ayraudi]|uniref:leukemia inhibitory factor receptor n=1 Tax=Nelusetta ayraudi TaxID=303726 RepID=UPI003F6E4F5D